MRRAGERGVGGEPEQLIRTEPWKPGLISTCLILHDKAVWSAVLLVYVLGAKVLGAIGVSFQDGHKLRWVRCVGVVWVWMLNCDAGGHKLLIREVSIGCRPCDKARRLSTARLEVSGGAAYMLPRALSLARTGLQLLLRLSTQRRPRGKARAMGGCRSE